MAEGKRVSMGHASIKTDTFSELEYFVTKEMMLNLYKGFYLAPELVQFAPRRKYRGRQPLNAVSLTEQIKQINEFFDSNAPEREKLINEYKKVSSIVDYVIEKGSEPLSEKENVPISYTKTIYDDNGKKRQKVIKYTWEEMEEDHERICNKDNSEITAYDIVLLHAISMYMGTRKFDRDLLAKESRYLLQCEVSVSQIPSAMQRVMEIAVPDIMRNYVNEIRIREENTGRGKFENKTADEIEKTFFEDMEVRIDPFVSDGFHQKRTAIVKEAVNKMMGLQNSTKRDQGSLKIPVFPRNTLLIHSAPGFGKNAFLGDLADKFAVSCHTFNMVSANLNGLPIGDLKHVKMFHLPSEDVEALTKEISVVIYDEAARLTQDNRSAFDDRHEHLNRGQLLPNVYEHPANLPVMLTNADIHSKSNEIEVLSQAITDRVEAVEITDSMAMTGRENYFRRNFADIPHDSDLFIFLQFLLEKDKNIGPRELINQVLIFNSFYEDVTNYRASNRKITTIFEAETSSQMAMETLSFEAICNRYHRIGGPAFVARAKQYYKIYKALNSIEDMHKKAVKFPAIFAAMGMDVHSVYDSEERKFKVESIDPYSMYKLNGAPWIKDSKTRTALMEMAFEEWRSPVSMSGDSISGDDDNIRSITVDNRLANVLIDKPKELFNALSSDKDSASNAKLIATLKDISQKLKLDSLDSESITKEFRNKVAMQMSKIDTFSLSEACKNREVADILDVNMAERMSELEFHDFQLTRLEKHLDEIKASEDILNSVAKESGKKPKEYLSMMEERRVKYKEAVDFLRGIDSEEKFKSLYEDFINSVYCVSSFDIDSADEAFVDAKGQKEQAALEARRQERVAAARKELAKTGITSPMIQMMYAERIQSSIAQHVKEQFEAGEPLDSAHIANNLKLLFTMPFIHARAQSMSFVKNLFASMPEKYVKEGMLKIGLKMPNGAIISGEKEIERLKEKNKRLGASGIELITSGIGSEGAILSVLYLKLPIHDLGHRVSKTFRNYSFEQTPGNVGVSL